MRQFDTFVNRIFHCLPNTSRIFQNNLPVMKTYSKYKGPLIKIENRNLSEIFPSRKKTLKRFKSFLMVKIEFEFRPSFDKRLAMVKRLKVLILNKYTPSIPQATSTKVTKVNGLISVLRSSTRPASGRRV